MNILIAIIIWFIASILAIVISRKLSSELGTLPPSIIFVFWPLLLPLQLFVVLLDKVDEWFEERMKE